MNQPIKTWSENDRPREKMLRHGKNALSDAELLAILIRTGTREKNAVEIARDILALGNQNLASLSRLSVDEMATIKGLGPVKAITICAALELGRRRRESEAILEKIANSRDAAAIMQPHLADLSHEEFWVILLNRANKVLTRKNISVGGTSGTVVDAKIIFKEAIQARCSGIILCHNHPSGNNRPSEADIQLTRKLKEGALQLDLAILDHIIIAGSSFFSFADEGLL